MVSAGSAKYNIEKVRLLALNDQTHSFSATRAINCVVSQFQCSIDDAKKFILAEVAKLTKDNFSETVLINGIVYDVYGKKIQNVPWYIKFSICEDDNGEYLVNMSFHPTEKELRTATEILEKYSP